jgi:hypothetical protein
MYISLACILVLYIVTCIHLLIYILTAPYWRSAGSQTITYYVSYREELETGSEPTACWFILSFFFF